MISLQQAREDFAELDTFGDDATARREAWNNYTDGLCKDGELSALQCHYAPSVDEPMPGAGTCWDALADDREYILGCMGVSIASECVGPTDAEMRPWGVSATHWTVILSCGGRNFTTPYHTGAAHTGAPELCDVVASLLSDAVLVDAYDDLDDFAESMGITKPSEAVAAWEACQRTARELPAVLGDLDDMRELFEGY